MKIEIETPGQEAYETLNERLVDFNRTKVNWGTAAFTVVLRDEIGSVRGGAHGVVRMGAVEIRSVWLDGDLRGRGFGAKNHSRRRGRGAQARGARGAARSDEFQARRVHQRLGYTSFGSFTYPDGVSRFYLSRAL